MVKLVHRLEGIQLVTKFLNLADLIVIELRALILEFFKILNFPLHLLLYLVRRLHCLVGLDCKGTLHLTSILWFAVMGAVIQLWLHISPVELESVPCVPRFFHKGIIGRASPFTDRPESSCLDEWLYGTNDHIGLSFGSFGDGLEAVSFFSVVVELVLDYGEQSFVEFEEGLYLCFVLSIQIFLPFNFLQTVVNHSLHLLVLAS